MKKSKFLVPLFAAALLLASCATNPGHNGPFNPATKSANLYAFQAATSIGLVGNASSNQAGPMLKMAHSDDQATDMIAEIEKYLPSVEAALTGMNEFTSALEEASEDPLYTTKMSISYKDIALKENSFIMYYNEYDEAGNLITKGEAGTDENTDTTAPNVDSNTDATPKLAKDDDEDDDDEKEDETEQETTMKGIVVIGEERYEMTGEKELDPVENEYEVSMTYTIGDSVITVQQEIEGTETEFEYEIKQGGKTIYEYSIEIEDEVELEVKQAGSPKTKYSFELVERDGKQLIKAKYKNGKEKVSYLFEKVVSETDGTASYVVVE